MGGMGGLTMWHPFAGVMQLRSGPDWLTQRMTAEMVQQERQLRKKLAVNRNLVRASV